VREGRNALGGAPPGKGCAGIGEMQSRIIHETHDSLRISCFRRELMLLAKTFFFRHSPTD
jgi:hypothetical protein